MATAAIMVVLRDFIDETLLFSGLALLVPERNPVNTVFVVPISTDIPARLCGANLRAERA
jgi:hypothetical protein